MASTPDTVIRQWFEQVWNRGDEAAIAQMTRPDTVIHGLQAPDGRPVTNMEGFRPFFHAFRQAFPDIHVTIEQTVSEADTVVALCRVTGTHTGAGLGVPPTGRPFSIHGMTMLRLADGKLVEGWNSYDFFGLFQQLGMVAMAGA